MAARQPDLVLSYIRMDQSTFPIAATFFPLRGRPTLVGSEDVPFYVAPSRLCVFSRKQGGSRPGQGAAVRPSAVPEPPAPRPQPALGPGAGLFFERHEAQPGTGIRSPVAIPEARSSASFALRFLSNSRFQRAGPFERFGESHEKSYIANPWFRFRSNFSGGCKIVGASCRTCNCGLRQPPASPLCPEKANSE